MKANIAGFKQKHCRNEVISFDCHVTHSPNDHLDFFENFNFHVLMFLKVYKHVFTRVRLCSSKKIHINITHIALMLI